MRPGGLQAHAWPRLGCGRVPVGAYAGRPGRAGQLRGRRAGFHAGLERRRDCSRSRHRRHGQPADGMGGQRPLRHR
ncbi:hypothetical protein G6F66_015751 [Rhizopus arrhizus]|nr:hypothetical protein G6F66_015751 [Rhizopus arrhizus]